MTYRITPRQIARRAEALALVAQGWTQASVGKAVGVSERSVRRWVAQQRLGVALPRGPLSDAMDLAFKEAAHQRAKATILKAWAEMAAEEARLMTAKVQKGLLPGAEPRPPDDFIGDDDVDDADVESDVGPSFVERVLGPDVDPDRAQAVAKRAAELLARIGG